MSREKEKCLDVLGLPHSSSEDDIKKAYRRLAKQYHPDKNAEDGAKEQFQEISYAYKYLIEGPAAVGAEDEEEGIPVEILIRLFPWMFGGNHFHHPAFNPFFHDPYGFYPGMYEESSDEDDYFYSSHVNGFTFKPSSTYTPGPSKEEKKKEKKKKAREKKKAAKMTKAPESPAPRRESKQTKETSSSEKAAQEDTSAKLQESKNKCNGPATNRKDDKEEICPHKNKTSDKVQNNVGKSSTQPGQDAQQTENKKSKKKLKQEQRKREREMELIANEFKQKQKEQAEKEARKEEMRKEKEKKEEIRREELRKKELEEQARQEEKRKEELSRREKEQEEAGKSERNNGIGDAGSPRGCDSTSWKTLSMSESEGRMENVDDVSDVDDGSCANGGYHDNKLRATDSYQGYSPAQGFGRDSNESFNSTQCVRPKVPHASRPHQQRQRSECKTDYKDTRSSSRGSERSNTSSQPDRQTYSSKKVKRNARKKQVEADDWSGEESNTPFESLMPQSEAEEMRMFHEAMIISEREAQQQGVVPETEEEERRMLEAALRESQRTAPWGGLDTFDDVSDFEDEVRLGVDSASCAGAGLGDWHQSIGRNSSRHNKENVKPNISLADTCIKLGGLGTTSRSSAPQDRGTASAGSSSHPEKFDKAVGGKVKGKSKSKTKKNASSSWEFGGGTKPVHTANTEGLQFGLVDFGSVSDEDESHIPSWAREAPAPLSSQYSNHESYEASGAGIGSMQKTGNQSGVNQSQWSSANSYKNLAPQTSGHQTGSQCSTGASHLSTGGLGDMDDIDDVDTFDDSSVPSFGTSTETSSSFDLNIPAAFRNIKMKSYYQRKM